MLAWARTVCSPHFVLAASEKYPEAEVVVSLIESKSNLSPKEYHYTVVLIDYTSGGSGEAVLYHTNELSEADLIRVLQEIWCDLGEGGGQRALFQQDIFPEGM